MSHADPGHHGAPAPIPHVLPNSLYLGIFGALLVLTVITVAVAQVDLGPFALPVAMLVAVVKATLVAAVFMHLWFDNKLNLMVFIVTLLFLAIFITLTAFDLLTRTEIDQTKRNFLPRDEAVQRYYEQNPGAAPLRPGLIPPTDPRVKDKLVDPNAAH